MTLITGVKAVHFRRADAAGWQVAGTTSPNPPVGCVLVDPADGGVIATGATEPPGGAHAEIVALRRAGERARGAHAYVTLEPCNHTGRTGPCAQALIEAQVAEVHYLFADPFRPAAGGGDRLRAAGVRVQGPYLDLREDGVVSSDWSTSTGIYSVEAWLFSVLRGRPHVTLKLARTADGFIAASDGSSQWITGPAARARVHADRAHRDVIVVGAGTVCTDNPRLTARQPEGTPYPHQPLRVALGRRNLPRERYAMFQGPPEQSLHLRTHDIAEALAELRARGVVDVLVEGGPTLIGAFLAAGIADRLQCYTAPAVLGAGLPGVHNDPQHPTTMADLRRLHPRGLTALGPDVLFIATALTPIPTPPRKA
ncbi:Riboflavin biosynthesis protein RibD [Corynebacterium heidelbergense]|nr:bifunctional diaminohydroxyphosphoribosylaminopyrimidine deaminase/5-amino-6-(5-phosphoribosylamino)uracil reductase RibD [Corynebacterium heidelbergense]WCZ36589.1 Riboflavin biosynthesis protein RibD [Corynebacterium heidelbergense]